MITLLIQVTGQKRPRVLNNATAGPEGESIRLIQAASTGTRYVYFGKRFGRLNAVYAPAA